MVHMKNIILIFNLLLISLLVNAKEDKDLPLPTSAQLTWQDAELAVLISYDLHVFDGKKYSQPSNRITPIPDMNIFNPVEYDMDQWIRSIKGMGAKIAVLTATHETGFALYQSDVNPYCMKALKWKDGKGDLVRDFVESCRKYGIKPGIYLGIRWNSFLGVHDFMMPKDGSQFQKNRQAFYNSMCEGMTEELVSRYGELAIIWYDGGAHGPELGGPDILPIVEKYQKNIVFYSNSQRADMRWGGSESGTVPYPCWGTFPYSNLQSKKNQVEIFKNDFQLLKTGDPDGPYYIPAMSDTPLRGYNGRHEWFWEPGDEAHIFPLERLMDMYEKSVGRNTTLIVGVTPDDRGLIPAPDSLRMAEFGSEIQKRFGTPLKYIAGKGRTHQIDFSVPSSISHMVIQEDIRSGERVRKYRIEGRVSGKWELLSVGTCIGHKRIEMIKTLKKVTSVRLKIEDSVGTPLIKMFAVY